ncbi:DUF6325 family protein [Gordonia alkaliphila]|uniref:DUF1269 domain-containing protein n=1 Tax=Gordonia alkaliphila TaxID=1053547 RepID=A0ABP8ZF40_9ACTN|nr:DUF6325 family protein [Gordonia alkaliphila]MCK0439362.1 DUF6325 family protein [Gordonia alkaliphila]
MTDNSSLLGPVELMMVSMPDTGISPQVLAALAAQVRAGTVRILDLVLVTRAGEDEIEATELSLDAVGIEIMDLALPGLTGDEDIALLAESLEVGESAAIVALELVWARDLGAALAAEGSEVIAAERIPSAVVNEIANLDN